MDVTQLPFNQFVGIRKCGMKEDDWKVFHESLEKKRRALLSFQIDVLNDSDGVVPCHFAG